MRNHRVCFVEIETNDNGIKQLKRLDGLAIRGRVHREMGNSLSDATVSIANLTKSDIDYLTTFSSPYVKPTTKKRINIYAGYKETGWGKIFSGDIEEAIPSDMPDTWLNIKAKSLYYQNRTPLSYGAQNISTQELGKSIADTLGLSFEWASESKKTFPSFNFTGSKAEIIKEFNQLDNITMYEECGVLKVRDKLNKRPNNTKKIISKDTGMIGIPEPDQFGVKVKCLLDASLFCGDWIEVRSVKIPAINGVYQIYTLDFDFASRENSFYCDIYAKTSGVL